MTRPPLTARECLRAALACLILAAACAGAMLWPY